MLPRWHCPPLPSFVAEVPTLLLLAPSSGYGGGIERVADAVEAAWQARVLRVDLYRQDGARRPSGRPLSKVGFSARACTAAVRARPRLILALHAGLLPVAHAAAALVRADVALTAHGNEVWSPMTRRQQWLIQRCRRLMAVSSFTAEWLARRAGVERSRVDVVPLPLAPEFARRLSSAPSGSGKDATFLTVSRIDAGHRYKGHFDIAQALPRVLESEPDARWVVVGTGDGLRALRAECEEMGVLRATDLRGRVSDSELRTAYENARFMALPSIADPDADPPVGEGFGLVYAEAAAFGLPSIASRRGGGSVDFVEHEVTGLTVPPADPPALADTIVRLLRDGSLARQLGSAARRRVAERHTPERFATALQDALVPGRR